MLDNNAVSASSSASIELNDLSLGNNCDTSLGRDLFDREKFIKGFQSLNFEGVSNATKKVLLTSILNFLNQRKLRCFEITETRRAILVPKIGNEHNLIIIRELEEEKIRYILIKRQYLLIKKDAKFLSEKLSKDSKGYEILKFKKNSDYKLIDDQNTNNYSKPFCTRLNSLRKELTEFLKTNRAISKQFSTSQDSLTESTVEECVRLVAQCFEVAARSSIAFLFDSKVQASQVHKNLMPDTNLREVDVNQIHLFCKAAPGEDSFQRRVTWYQSFPNFINLVSGNLELTNAIDDKQPFKEVAAKYFNCEAALISRLATGNFTGEYFLLILLLLSGVPISTIPNRKTTQDSEAWQAIATISHASKLLLWGNRVNQEAILVQSKNSDTLATRTVRNFGIRSKDSFLEIANALTPSLQTTSRFNYGPYICCTFEEANDYISLLTNTITLPLLLRYNPTINIEESRETLKLITLWYLSNFCNPLQIYKLSQQWHKTFGQQTLRSSEFMEWKGLCLPQKLNNGYNVVPLTSNYELFQEGLAMHHCVASMTTDCCRYKKFIFSLRDQENKRESTLTLKLDTKNSFYEFEHKSRQNSDVSQEANSAAILFIENLNRGKISRLLTCNEISSRVNMAQLGFDFQNLEVWREVFGSIVSFLPKSQQKFSCPVELAKAVGLTELREFIELTSS